MSDNEAQKNTTVAEAINSDKNLTENFITTVYERVLKKIDEKEEKKVSNFRYITSFVLGLLALFAGGIYFATTSYIDNSIRKGFEVEVQKMKSAIDEALKLNLATYKADGLLARLRDISNAIDNSDKFSLDQQLQAMDLLKKYKKEEGELSKEFLSCAHKLIRSFKGAGDNYYIDDIWALYGDDLLSSKDVALLMMEIIGERYLMAIYNAKENATQKSDMSLGENSIDSMHDLKVMFDKLKKIVSEKYNYPEIPLVYEIGIAYNNGSNVKKNQIDMELKCLSVEDRMNFLYKIFRYTKWEHWLKKGAKNGLVLQDIYGKLFDQYGKDIKLSVGEDAFMKIKSRHEDPAKTNELIAAIVAWWQSTPLPN